MSKGFFYILETKQGLIVGESTYNKIFVYKDKYEDLNTITNECKSTTCEFYRTKYKRFLRYLGIKKAAGFHKISFEYAKDMLLFVEGVHANKPKKEKETKKEIKSSKSKVSFSLIKGRKFISAFELASFFGVDKFYINRKLSIIKDSSGNDPFINHAITSLPIAGSRNELFYISYDGLSIFWLSHYSDFINKKALLLRKMKFSKGKKI